MLLFNVNVPKIVNMYYKLIVKYKLIVFTDYIVFVLCLNCVLYTF